MSTYLSISSLESPKNTLDLFDSLINIATELILNLFDGSQPYKQKAKNALSQFLVLYI